MRVSGALAPLVIAVLGLALSLGVERLLKPRVAPLRKRPRASFALHAGIWFGLFSGLLLLLGRPWFAVAIGIAALLLVVLVSNAKAKSLREPFVFQDYEYFTDALRHPRLYIPFLGWGKAIAAALGFGAALAIGLWLEAVPDDRWLWSGQLGAIAGLATLSVALLVGGNRARLVPTFDPQHDLHRLGLLASLWCYARAEREELVLCSPFDFIGAPAGEPRPHLVAVQSESFFDPRPLFAGIRSDVLGEFDALKRSAFAHGKLRVPAWGANTVRSEFAFLSAIEASRLGVHRFNPYRKLVGNGIASLASHLKRLGYRTVCVHPYAASFYGRNKVMPALGFDAFIDIRSFAGSERCGPYIGDEALARHVCELVTNADEPIFIYVITMENHGPLHLETATADDVRALYDATPPPGCEDLTIYLRHLRNADRMLATLRETLARLDRPASLCWFGDHVPIMAEAYEALGAPAGDTEYLLWNNVTQPAVAATITMEVDQLALRWLAGVGLSVGSSIDGIRATAISHT